MKKSPLSSSFVRAAVIGGYVASVGAVFFHVAANPASYRALKDTQARDSGIRNTDSGNFLIRYIEEKKAWENTDLPEPYLDKNYSAFTA